MRALPFVLLAWLSVSPVMAQFTGESLANPAQEARARDLQKTLRCVVCQGQSIDESDAALAADLRRLIREHIARGDSDQEIRDFLVARYGDFILMQPPLRSDTLALWFGPIVIILGGVAVLAWTLRRSRHRMNDISS